jgi:hypothetical protein
MIIHFGKNPRKGGSPPKETSNKNNEMFIILLELNILKV